MRELTTPAGAVVACVFTFFSPLLWLNSVRPMSDLVGFFAVTTAQALVLTSRAVQPARWHAVAFLCGAIAGIRVQSVLLTGPLICYVTARDGRPWLRTAVSVGAGVAAWAIPLVVLMGGAQSAAASFAPVVRDTLTEDAMAAQWTVRTALFAARDLLFSPWQDSVMGGVLVALAGTGALTLASTAPQRLILPLLLYGPYVVFNYAVQDTGTLRYNIPAIPLFALLASIPLTQWGLRKVAVPAATVAFVAAASATTLPALKAYSATPSPMMQAVDALATRATSERAVVSGHFTFERYLPLLPDGLERLPLLHGKEWQSLTDYWTSGRRDPVLFLREAHRTDYLQFGRDTQTVVGHWEWPAEVRPFLKAARPGNIDLVRLDPPRWTIESGAFVTDEAGPYERVIREPHRFYVQPKRFGQVLILSGSTDSVREPVELSLQYGATVTRSSLVNGFFTLHTVLPPMATQQYVAASLNTRAPVAITDLWVTDARQPAIRPGRGFYRAERDPQGRVFRWTATDASATVYLPGESADLTIDGWIPRRYYDGPVTLSLGWGGQPLASLRVESESFRHRLRLIRPSDDAWGELTIASSQSFVPHQRTGNGDRRVLGARIYELRLDELPRLNASRE
jgi:hypothetical protein